MSATLDQYITGLERTIRELPSLLAEWSEIDPDLQAEYMEQLIWLLEARGEMLGAAGQDDRRFTNVATRIASATAAMFDMRQELFEKMGIRPEWIVPFTIYTTADRPNGARVMAA